MKRTTLAILFACLTLAVSAQDAVQVKFSGATPDIVDFAWALAASADEEMEDPMNGLRRALMKYRAGKSLTASETLVVDKKNGYLCYETKGDNYSSKQEMCYWNMTDKKHKLVGYCCELLMDGKRIDPGQFDNLTFYRYNNATKKMSLYDAGVEVEYSNISYSLPRTGKDITVTRWDKNGKAFQQTLKFSGLGFR